MNTGPDDGTPGAGASTADGEGEFGDPEHLDGSTGDQDPSGAEDGGAGEGEPAGPDFNIESLPIVQETRRILAERGYGENDPVQIYIHVAAIFARELQKDRENFHQQQEQLTTRQVNMFAAVTDTLRELKEELANCSVQMQELQDSNDAVGENHVALMETFERVLKVCGQFTPFLEKAAREIVVAAGIIENRSLRAMILSYLSPAIALIAGVLIGIVVK